MAERQGWYLSLGLSLVAEKHGLQCVNCASPTERGAFQGNGLTLNYQSTGPQTIVFSISGVPTGLFFGGNVQAKMDALRNELKAEFGKRFMDLEFVEPLPRKRAGG